MKQTLVRATALAAALVLTAGAVEAATAEVPNLQIISVMPGLGNRVRSDSFFPVAVELAAQRDAASGTIVIETNAPNESVPRYSTHFDLRPGTRYRYFVYPHCGGTREDFTLVVSDQRGRVVRRETLLMTPHEKEAYLAGVLGTQGVPGMASKRAADQKACGLDVTLIAGDFMPTRACGYDPADVLVWTHPDPAGLSPAQIGALREWVLAGGRLVLALGDTWEPTASTFLKELVPGTVTGMAEAADLGGLAAVGAAAFNAGDSMSVAVLENVRGEVLVSAGRLPLVVKGRAGFGEVIFIAFDPTRNPFATWSGAQKFWNYLLGLEFQVSGEGQGASQRPVPNYGGYYGRWGMRNRLSGAMNEFAAIRPISFAFVVGFLLVYVVLVGPVDYFVLKRLKHLEWTWFTFPTVAIGATLLAFFVIAATRSAHVYINQMTVMDWSSDGTIERTHAVSALISPRNARYDVSYRTPGGEMYLADPVSAGYGMGGFKFTQPFDLVDHPETGMTASRIFLPVWGPRTFWGRLRTTETGKPPVTANIRIRPDGTLTGTLTNNGEALLENTYFVHRKGVLRVGMLGPGKPFEIDLTRKVSFDEFVRQVTEGLPAESQPWDHREPQAFEQNALPMILAASFAEDSRYYPARYWQQWRTLLEGSDERTPPFDLEPELSVRSLVDSGQAVVIGTSDGAGRALDAGVAGPVRQGFTVYRVCVALSAE